MSLRRTSTINSKTHHTCFPIGGYITWNRFKQYERELELLIHSMEAGQNNRKLALNVKSMKFLRQNTTS